jgi:hypothetical protein
MLLAKNFVLKSLKYFDKGTLSPVQIIAKILYCFGVLQLPNFDKYDGFSNWPISSNNYLYTLWNFFRYSDGRKRVCFKKTLRNVLLSS